MFAPHLFDVVPRRRQGISVRDTINNRSWVRDIQGTLTSEVLCDYVNVWEKVDGISLQRDISDRFIWHGFRMVCIRHRRPIEPPKCKFFFWLLLHDRLWMAARRKRHGLQDNEVCALRSQETEMADHLTTDCVFAREVWLRVLAPLGLGNLTPLSDSSIVEWWLQSRLGMGQQQRKTLDKILREALDNILILKAWCLWKERNTKFLRASLSYPAWSH